MRRSVLLFVAAFSLRLIYIAASHENEVAKAPFQAALAAISFAERGTLGDVHWNHSGPSAHTAPLYPLLLASIIRLCGGWNGVSKIVARVLGATVSSAAIALVPQVSRGLGWGIRPGSIAAIVLAVLPVHWDNETIQEWEAPFAALNLELIVLTLLTIVRTRPSYSVAGLILGLLLGIASLLSPPVLLAGLAAITLQVAADRQTRFWLIRTTCVAMIVCLSFLTPWIYRNYRVLGGLVVFRSNFGLELCIGNSDNADGGYRATIERFHPYVSPQRREELREVGELAFMQRRKQDAVTWIKEHPGRFVLLCLRRFAYFWFAPNHHWGSISRIRKLVAAPVVGTISILVFASLTRLFAKRSPFRFVILAIMIGYSAIYTLAPVTQRDELQMVGAFVIGTISILAFASLTRLFYECSPFRFVILGVMIGYSAIYTITHVHLRYEFPIFWLNALLAMGCIDHLCIARDVAHGNRT